MAIPSPTTYTCPSCNWSKTVRPRSDALMPGDFFDACPSCGHSPLVVKVATAADSALGQLVERVRKALR